MSPIHLALVAALALATGACAGEHDEPKVAPAAAHSPLTDCMSRWTLGAKIAIEQAQAPCHDVTGETFTPTVLHCDPIKHDQVKVDLVLGPDGDYATYVAGERLAEVDDGTGTGDFRDTRTAPEQEAYCGVMTQ